MIYYCDIDNTICYTNGSDYENSVPRTKRIEYMNSLFQQGHEVHYWTARGGMSGIDHTALTQKQLNDWGVKYTSLKMGKPSFDVFIDDKAFNDKDFFDVYCNRK